VGSVPSVGQLKIYSSISRELKNFAVTRMWNRGEEVLSAELAKCQLLCTLHHLEKTRVEIGVKHGGGLAGKRNCKCELCREQKRRYMREWKRRKRSTT
jgi:hypothetical protein